MVVLEKGSEPGAHILSGAVMDPRGDHRVVRRLEGTRRAAEPAGHRRRRAVPLGQRRDAHARLAGARNLHNDGNYVVSLEDVVKWLAQQAEGLGVEIFPGFAAAEVLYDEQGRVKGVATGNVGIGKDGEPHDGFQLGMELHGKYTVFAEGARGHLGKQLHRPIQARRRPRPAELRHRHQGVVGGADPTRPSRAWWCTPPAGRWTDAFGGGFLYHLADNKVTLGFVIGLDYANPYLSPFEEMQRWKTHPAIRAHIEGGKRLGYGARAINNGTPQACPRRCSPAARWSAATPAT